MIYINWKGPLWVHKGPEGSKRNQRDPYQMEEPHRIQRDPQGSWGVQKCPEGSFSTRRVPKVPEGSQRFQRDPQVS